jgi:hypothetical protein
MKCPTILLAGAGLMILSALNARAVDVKLIANSSVKADRISPEEIKRVFLQQKNSLADGSHVEPVLERDGPSHEAFLKMYMGRTDDDLQTYYRALVFTGRGSMPKALGSDAEMVAYVARTRGAIRICECRDQLRRCEDSSRRLRRRKRPKNANYQG